MSLITISYIALALFLGYTVAVCLSMAATFGITAASRSFVSKNYRIRARYKFVQDAVWLVCSEAGGYGYAYPSYGYGYPYIPIGVSLGWGWGWGGGWNRGWGGGWHGGWGGGWFFDSSAIGYPPPPGGYFVRKVL